MDASSGISAPSLSSSSARVGCAMAGASTASKFMLHAHVRQRTQMPSGIPWENRASFFGWASLKGNPSRKKTKGRHWASGRSNTCMPCRVDADPMRWYCSMLRPCSGFESGSHPRDCASITHVLMDSSLQQKQIARPSARDIAQLCEQCRHMGGRSTFLAPKRQ